MSKFRSQKMAQDAYSLVTDIKGKEVESKYRTLALTFSSMILQSGLSQATGFLLAKGKFLEKTEIERANNEFCLLLNHLAELLSDDKTNKMRGDDLHQLVLNASITEYQLLTRKALDASTCLKRYTEALLESEKDRGKANE